MILALAIFLPLLAVIVWLFLRAQNREQLKGQDRRFNVATLGVVVASCAAVSLYFWQTTGQSDDRAWWPVLAVLASTITSIVILAIAGMVRAILFRNGAAQ